MTGGATRKRTSSSFEDNSVNKKQKLQKTRRTRRHVRRSFTLHTRKESLAATYGYVSTLHEFLTAIGAYNAKALRGKFSSELAELLQSTLVGVESIDKAREFLESRSATFLIEVNPSHEDVSVFRLV